LIASGAPPAAREAAAAAPDRGELSWTAIGRMLLEASFKQVYRRVDFEREKLSTSPDEFLASMRPAVAEHPLVGFLDAHAWDVKKSQKHLPALEAAIPLDDLEMQARALPDALMQSKPQFRLRAMARAMNHRDLVARDAAIHVANTGLESQVAAVRELLAIHPYSPYGRGMMVGIDWPSAQPHAAVWEQEAAAGQPFVLLMLGRRYAADKRLPDAERCLRAAIKLSPTQGAFESLAEIYLQQNKLDQWLATLEEYLKYPESGLGHASVRVKIANYFVSRGQYAKALPYAEAAAETGAGWAMMTAGGVHEFMQNWEKAEEFIEATSRSYTNSELDWYLFCRRTGQGDLAGAEQLALSYVERAKAGRVESDLVKICMFHQVRKEHDQALPLLERLFANTGDPLWGLHAALAADAAGNAAKRDQLLADVKNRGGQFRSPYDRNQPRAALLDLAGLLAADLAQGGKAWFDPAALKALREKGPRGEQLNVAVILANYLAQHGKPDEAVPLWLECMSPAHSEAGRRTLSGSALWERGITPDVYKDRLKPTQ
jgi:tetratricopeptide (TPR) repeat protein